MKDFNEKPDELKEDKPVEERSRELSETGKSSIMGSTEDMMPEASMRDNSNKNSDEQSNISEIDSPLTPRVSSNDPSNRVLDGMASSQPSGEISDLNRGALSTNDYMDREGIRMEDAAARIRQIDSLAPERWSQLDVNEKAIALNEAGQALAEVYHQPNPPLFVDDLGKPTALGTYGDGYRFDPAKGDVKGSTFGIQMNREFEMDGKKLFGDDPRQALETYAHEYRHAYQAEQASRYEKPQFRNLVDDEMKAFEWSQNINEYKDPSHGFEAYYNQPIEKDARAFAELLVQKIYG